MEPPAAIQGEPAANTETGQRLLCPAIVQLGSPLNAILPCRLGMDVKDDLRPSCPSHMGIHANPQMWFGADGAVGYAVALSRAPPRLLHILQASTVFGESCLASEGYDALTPTDLNKVRRTLAKGGPITRYEVSQLRQCEELLELWDRYFLLKAAG